MLSTSLCSNKRKNVSTAIEVKNILTGRSRSRTCKLRLRSSTPYPLGHMRILSIDASSKEFERHFTSQSLPKVCFISVNETVQSTIQKVDDIKGMIFWRVRDPRVKCSGGIRTHAPEKTGA